METSHEIFQLCVEIAGNQKKKLDEMFVSFWKQEILPGFQHAVTFVKETQQSKEKEL